MSEQRRIEELRIHSFNREVYGEPDTDLAQSLASFGLQHPIQITPDGGILSGARRWAAADAIRWETIATEQPDIDFGDGVAMQKFVLLANAYRTSKSKYTQKKEADGYLKLLRIGELTKDELRAVARQRGQTVSERDGPDNEPVRLAARAAGLSPPTYHRYRYVDDGGAERAIDEALGASEIKPQQASALKRELEKDRAKLQKGVAADTVEKNVRERLETAKLTDEERHAEATVERCVRMIYIIEIVAGLQRILPKVEVEEMLMDATTDDVSRWIQACGSTITALSKLKKELTQHQEAMKGGGKSQSMSASPLTADRQSVRLPSPCTSS